MLKTNRRPATFFSKLASDQLVLQIVKGYKIPLKCIPHQWWPFTGNVANYSNTRTRKEGSTEEVKKVDNQFLSTLFILKQGEKNRPVFNLKSLNHCVRLKKFKWEGLEVGDGLNATPTWRLRDETRLTERTLMVPMHDQHSDVPEIPSSGQNLRIPVSSAQSIISSNSILSSPPEFQEADHCRLPMKKLQDLQRESVNVAKKTEPARCTNWFR